jgi:hypothetical protein
MGEWDLPDWQVFKSKLAKWVSFLMICLYKPFFERWEDLVILAGSQPGPPLDLFCFFCHNRKGGMQ